MTAVKGLLFVILITNILTTVQGVICLFHHLKADCDYPVDGFSMTRIQATINECEDPPNITIRLTCNSPKLEWSRTFSGAVDTAEIKGYFHKIFLQVKQEYNSKTGKYHIQTTILSQIMKNVEIMNSHIRLIGASCSILNEKSKIAVAVLGSLAGIAVIAVIVLLIIRRWRMRPMTYQSETGLIENPEQPDNNSFPVNSATFNRSTVTNDQNSHEVQDMVTYTGLSRNDHQRF